MTTEDIRQCDFILLMKKLNLIPEFCVKYYSTHKLLRVPTNQISHCRHGNVASANTATRLAS